MFARPVRTWFILLVLAYLCGCLAVPPTAWHSSAPLFQPSAEDTVQLGTVASALDTLALECAADSSVRIGFILPVP
jgi:hypothetical protein